MKIGEIAQQAKHMLYMQKALILPAVTQCLLKKIIRSRKWGQKTWGGMKKST